MTINVTNFTPPVGSTISTGGTIAFDVTFSPAVEVEHVIRLSFGNSYDIAWDGEGFLDVFAASTRAVISGGYRYTIRRTGSWPGVPIVSVRELAFGSQVQGSEEMPDVAVGTSAETETVTVGNGTAPIELDGDVAAGEVTARSFTASHPLEVGSENVALTRTGTDAWNLAGTGSEVVSVNGSPPAPLPATALPLKPSADTTGATDRAAIQAALTAGRLVYLVPGATYYLDDDFADEHGLILCIGGEARIVAGSAWAGSASIFRGNVIRVIGEQDLRPNYTATANHPAVTGSRSSAARSITSSIDAAITDTKHNAVWDQGRAAAVATYGKMPVFLFLHGYNGTYGSITDDPRVRACNAGFYVITPNLRGRSPSLTGAADDSARELYDIDDAIAYEAATNPTLVDTSRIFVLGLSGGGANAIAYGAKRPGKCVAIVACFGWGDYGVSPSASHSWWGYDPSERTTIETRIGARDPLDLAPYRARNSLTNLAQSLNLGSTKFFVLWDSEDTTTGNLSQDVVDALIAGNVPRSKWYSEKSTPDSDIRWTHGYVEDNPDLIYAEYLLYNLRDEPAATAADFGEYTVVGHCKHPGFEVWTDVTGSPNPRTEATGGQRYSVELNFNVRTGQYLVEPLEGDCRVLVKLADGTEISKEVTE